MRRHPARSATSLGVQREHAGFTLLEIILAIAIFMGSLVVLGELLAIGGRAAVQSQLETEAILRCESKLGEIVAGVEPLNSVSGTAFSDDASWSWSLDVAPGPVDGLLELTVSVARGGQSQTTAFSLVRLMRDPQMFLDALLEEEAAAAEADR